MVTSAYGAFRTDSTMTNIQAATNAVGQSFEISAYSTILIEDGADGSIIDGDDVQNENPNDPTQTLVGGNIIFWDYTIEVTDGTNTYEVGIVDYDINNDGTSTGINAEDGYFLAFLNGVVPPLNTTLTISGIVSNGPNIDVDLLIPCFTSGTQISTPQGLRKIETLRVGDEVLTLDNGAQTIRWIGNRFLDRIDLKAKPKLCPIRIEKGALGNNMPANDLCVSHQHRMLVRSPIAARMFSTEEVLVPAHKLVGIPGITVESSVESITYFHILFDHHEVIFSESAPSESLFTGPEALKSVGKEALAEITELFPAVLSKTYEPKMARLAPPKGKRTKALVRRHIKNKMDLVAKFRPNHQNQMAIPPSNTTRAI